MLEVKNLCVRLEEEKKEILKGVNLTIKPGEVHAIMGPNGSGKSTMSYVLSGKPGYEVTAGEVKLDGTDVLDLEPEERAALGLFLAFQYPIEIPGVGNMTFFKDSSKFPKEVKKRKRVECCRILKVGQGACKTPKY